MATQLTPLKSVERLSPRVVRILGGNPGKFTLQGTNTYLLGHGSKRILIDTGEGKPSWIKDLRSVLESEKASVETCLLTHWHHDHIDGVSDLLGICSSARIFKHQPALHGDGEKWSDFQNGHVFKGEGVTLRAIHCPGHTKDHMALILEEEDAMFTGDNVLGHGTAVFEDLAIYMGSLEVMKTKFGGRAYPGHGDVIEDGKAKIEDYIAHRKERERQVFEVLGNNPEARGWTSMEIVKVVYKDVPVNLHVPAEGGVVQILHKLRADGRVTLDEGRGKWRVSGSSSL